MVAPNGLMFDRRRPAVMRRPGAPGAPVVPQPEAMVDSPPMRPPGALTPPAPKSMAGPAGMDKAMGDMAQGAVPKVPTGGTPGQSGGNGLMQRRSPRPVTMDREGTAVPGVSGRLHTLLDSDSPYLDRARTRAKQYANRRGLMNSSIAAGAGETAAIDAALPIAHADANIAAGERAMRSQEFQQARSIRSQELMQERGLDHDTAMREADRELSKLLQARDHRVQQLMQTQRLDHDAAQRQATREMQQSLAADDRRAAATRQAAALSHASAEAEKSRVVQQQIAAQSVVQSINAETNRWTTALALQTDLPPEVREQYQDRIDFMRDESLSAAKNINNYVPKWTSARRPEGAAEATA